MKVGVMRFSALGDIAYTLPFLRALTVKPLIVTTPLGRELLRDEFDDFLLLKSKRLADLFSLVVELRRRRFDRLIDLQNNDRSWAIGALSGARQRYTNRGMPRGVPTYDNMLRILEPSGLLGPLDTEFRPKPREYIVLNAGSSPKWASKRLPTAKWRAFAERLAERFGLPFVLTGAADEVDYVAELAKHLPGEVRNLAGRTSLPELKALLGGAYLTVSTDSAAMHIAAAQKTPTIGLFGATNWLRSAPFGPWSTVLYDRSRYADGRPPIPNLEASGPYYDHIDLNEGLERLAPFLESVP